MSNYVNEIEEKANTVIFTIWTVFVFSPLVHVNVIILSRVTAYPFARV